MSRKITVTGIGSLLSVAASITLSATAVVLGTGALVSTANAQDSILEEIIVVATRREESVQDIAVAVTAITGTTLEKSGVEDVFQLQQQAPGLVVSRSQQSTVTTFAIRGIGTSSQNFGLESSVGLYVDGVYRSRQSSVVNNLVDLTSVEILRGPQGTLFGKNTPSGAVLMRTVAPGDTGHGGRAASDANAFVEVTGGDFGLINVSGATNIPLIADKMALRATIFSAQRDGYVSELTTGQSDVINDINRIGGRLQLYYTPSDTFRMRVIADYSEIDEICCAALTRQDNVVAFGRDDGAGGPVFGSDALLLQAGGTVFTIDDFENRVMALNRLPTATNEDSGLSVEFNWDLANSTLTSISAYRAFDTTDFIDADFTDVDFFTKLNTSEQSSFSQEFRLDGDWGDRVQYVVGAFYFSQQLDSDNTLFAGPAISPLVLADPVARGVFDLVNGISAATGGALPPAGLPISSDGFAREVMLQDHSSWAVFGQFDFSLTDSLTLTAGLRYTDETKDLNGQFFEGPLGQPLDFVAILTEVAIFQNDPGAYNPVSPESLAAFNPVRVTGWASYLPNLSVFTPRPDVNEKLTDDQVSGTIKLSWFATDDMMLYASFGTGYKSGGTNTDRISTSLDYIFGPETSESYELGLKTEFGGGKARLNIAVHKTDFDDLQSNTFTGTGFSLRNAGRAETQGAEVEFMWAPLDNLDFQVGSRIRVKPRRCRLLVTSPARGFPTTLSTTCLWP
jgi:outer membrane receptor protein involved in Fe transport